MYHVSIYSDYDRTGCGYKYIVTKGATAWTAFRTQKGWERFLSLTGLKFQETDSGPILFGENKGQDLTIGVLTGPEVEEQYFYNIGAIPKDSVKFLGLCNGGLVTCYAFQGPEKTVIYRPNPNAKKVYDPLPLNAHIAFTLEMG